MKKLIKSFLICTLMLLALSVTVSAETEGNFTYTVSGKKVTITGFPTDVVGEVIIPSEIGGYPVTTIGDAAFYNCTSLTSIVIPDSVTEIGNYAFSSCSSLTSVNVDENNDNYCSIDGNLFDKNKTTLIQYAIGKTNSSYTIPDSVTTIGGAAFYNCSSLTSVVIGDSVTTIGGSAFGNCTNLTSVVIPDSVITIGSSAFYSCNSLTSVEIPDSVTIIGNSAFNSCSSLTSVYYRGNSTQWNNISIGSYNSKLTSANRIYNSVKIKAYDNNNNVLFDKYVDSSKTTYKSLFSNKTGYTLTIYTDNTFTETIDANSYITEDSEVYVDYVINQYTYKFVDWNGTVIKEVTADYQTVIEKPENPTREGDAKYSSYTFSKWSGYTEGMKLTRDITFTAVYDTTYNHHIELIGTTSVTVGNSLTEKVSMVTLKPVNYLICEIVYPDVLELNSITPRDFKYASQESLKNKDGFNYLTVICQYEDDETTVPENTSINPFNLSFSVSKTAKPQEIEIKFGEDTYLSGEEDYPFENKINAKIQILPKLASSVTIYGDSTIYEPYQYTAEVYPDYTTDKTIEWSVNDETVATISKDGILTPVKNGEVTITATAVGGTYRTKTITVYRNAYVDGFKSDVGMWNEKIMPDTKEYTIYVTEDTSVINITPLFTTGTLKYDNAVVMKNRQKEFELTEDETIITLARSDAGYQDCTYTIKVIKKPGLKNETIKAESFKEDCINLLVYNKNVVQVEDIEDITITIPETVKCYKILYWESLANLKPVYEPIIKEL